MAHAEDTSNFQLNALARVKADRMRLTLEEDVSDEGEGGEEDAASKVSGMRMPPTLCPWLSYLSCARPPLHPSWRPN